MASTEAAGSVIGNWTVLSPVIYLTSRVRGLRDLDDHVPVEPARRRDA